MKQNIRKNSCTACTFLKNGVKTRKAIPHTCGKDFDMSKLKVTETMKLSQKDAEIFFNELMNPSPPNEALIKAAERFKKEMGEE